MSECPAGITIGCAGMDSTELNCNLWPDHQPPIHLDRAVGIHWFRMEEQPGYEPGASLAYERPSG